MTTNPTLFSDLLVGRHFSHPSDQSGAGKGIKVEGFLGQRPPWSNFQYATVVPHEGHLKPNGMFDRGGSWPRNPSSW
jgi:hypothetical protein